MKIIVVGCGYMANEYLNVLLHLNCDVIVIGRSKEKVTELKNKFPQFIFFDGGLDNYIDNNNEVTDFAINAVSINNLKDTSIKLIKAGVKYLLLEKPGDLQLQGLVDLDNIAKINTTKIWIAYNRRFYASVKRLNQEIEIDGGVSSAHFEFTEWIQKIDSSMYDAESLNKWILANSSHVIDTVFSIIGLPKTLSAMVQGQNVIEWHPSGNVFTGSGISINNIPYTYHSNWESAGRWSIEVITKNRRFYLKPMEKLQVQLKGSIQVNEFVIDDQIDCSFKPGLLLQTNAFLDLEVDKLVSIEEQIKMMPFYDMIGGY